MKKTLIVSALIIVLSVASIVFIKLSNNHLGCEVITKTTVSDDGLTKVTTARHSCNENFNL